MLKVIKATGVFKPTAEALQAQPRKHDDTSISLHPMGLDEAVGKVVKAGKPPRDTK